MLENPEILSPETDSNAKVQRVGLLPSHLTNALENGHLTTLETFSKPRGIVTDAELAHAFHALYDEATSGLKRIIAFGMFCYHIQEEYLKKGQFDNWCQQHVPHIKRSAIYLHKSIAKSALEKVGLTVRDALKIARGGSIMLIQSDTLNDAERELQNRLFTMIEGKSLRQLMLEFKVGEAGPDGELRPKVGRVKGEGGKRKLTEMEKAGQARERVQLLAKDTCANLDVIAAGFMLMDDNALDYFEATLSRHVEAIRAWKRQPRNDRHPELIYARFSQGGN